VAPDEKNPVADSVSATLTRLGWRPPSPDEGFTSGQPQYVFQVPLEGRTGDELLAGLNQLWRRNVKKAGKAGVAVTQGTEADLPAFHELYLETATRDHFTGRPLSYFQRMWSAMRAEDPDRIRLYLAHHDGDLVAATTLVRVGRHAWYSYGASSSAKREVRGSNAVQWQMLRDAAESGAAVYDLRGITDTLAEDDPHFGLIQFKLGTGGEAVEYLGEWDLPLNRLLFKAFEVYMDRRG
jgi:lipid II:glycine glycyltransferase (peptidoglycan interpeptide bridge formation enzyme)